MDSLKCISPAFGCPVELIDDVNNGIALTRGKWEFVGATAISVGEADAIRMRDWLNAKYPAAHDQGEVQRLREAVKVLTQHLLLIDQSKLTLELVDAVAASTGQEVKNDKP